MANNINLSSMIMDLELEILAKTQILENLGRIEKSYDIYGTNYVDTTTGEVFLSTRNHKIVVDKWDLHIASLRMYNKASK